MPLETNFEKSFSRELWEMLLEHGPNTHEKATDASLSLSFLITVYVGFFFI